MGKRRTGSFKALISIVVIAIIVVVAVFFGVDAYKKCEYEYKLSSHPLKYSDYVEQYSAEFGVDKYLIYSIIKTESGFDSEAVSNVGARGLMQIMEETFDWIKYRLDDGDEMTYDKMFEAEHNIRYGAYLISYLIKYFGDKDTAVAAYHSGIGTVSEWLTDKGYSADGVKLDNIPSKTAAHYVNKINNALAVYNELYTVERKG